MPSEFDEWPAEPAEPDPESRWSDPEDDLVSVPSVEDLDPGSEGAGIEVDGEIARLFWAAVVYANLALGGVSVGLLLIGFRGQLMVGGAAVAVGLLALYRTYDVYQRYRERVVESQDGDGDRMTGDEEGDGDDRTADDGAGTEINGGDGTDRTGRRHNR